VSVATRPRECAAHRRARSVCKSSRKTYTEIVSNSKPALVLTVLEQCSNTKVPSTEDGRLHNNNLSRQHTSSREAAVKMCRERARYNIVGERVVSLVLCIFFKASSIARNYHRAESSIARHHHRAASSLREIIHRAVSRIARYHSSRGITHRAVSIARYSSSRGIIIARHHPSRGITHCAASSSPNNKLLHNGITRQSRIQSHVSQKIPCPSLQTQPQYPPLHVLQFLFLLCLALDCKGLVHERVRTAAP
jgi:hypothetical protein